MITTADTHYRRQPFTAAAHHALLTPEGRLDAARAVLALGRAPAAEFRPDDAPLIMAWQDVRDRCRNERADAAAHIDTFLIAHFDSLRDCALRARDGAGPGPFLDDVELALKAC